MFFFVLFCVGKIYNNFGRIGIYTPQQRLVIMNRYRLNRKKAVPIQKKKRKKAVPTQKMLNVLDAADKAALASAELVNAPVNSDCPDDLKAKYGEFFSRSGQYMPAVFFSHFKCSFLYCFA